MRLTLLLSILLVVTACKESGKPGANSPTLVGKWKPVEMEIPNMSKNEIQNVMDNFLMEFTADGKYRGEIHTEKQAGTYTFDPNSGKLTIINNNGVDHKEEVFTVKWEKELLMLVNNEGTVKLKRQ